MRRMKQMRKCIICDKEVEIDPSSPIIRITCGGKCSKTYIKVAEHIRHRYKGKYLEAYKEVKK